jgi:hypothetical protein
MTFEVQCAVGEVDFCIEVPADRSVGDMLRIASVEVGPATDIAKGIAIATEAVRNLRVVLSPPPLVALLTLLTLVPLVRVLVTSMTLVTARRRRG